MNVFLKYVGKEDLEKTWKITRRERLKKQEEKIWEEFIMEQDIVRNVSQGKYNLLVNFFSLLNIIFLFILNFR